MLGKSHYGCTQTGVIGLQVRRSLENPSRGRESGGPGRRHEEQAGLASPIPALVTLPHQISVLAGGWGGHQALCWSGLR